MPILCGTDFSPAAAQALEAAAAIAQRSGSALQVVCATGQHVQLAALPDTSQGIHDAGPRHAAPLEATVARLRAAGVAADGVLDPRVAEEALTERARAGDVPLVILGAVGHPAIERLLLGSVAERVAMSSPRPVLVARDGAPWTRWRERAGALRVSVAVDPGASARAALAWAGWLASLGDVELSACWIVHPAFENERFGASGPGAGVELLPATLDALNSEFAQRVAALLPERAVELHLEPNLGRVDSALIECAHARHADVLVVGSHQRHGFERLWSASVSRGALHHAPMSVVVVPLAEEDGKTSE